MHSEIERIHPVEILLEEGSNLIEALAPHPAIKHRPTWEFEHSTAIDLLCQQFNTRDLLVGVSELTMARRCWLSLQYVQYPTQSTAAYNSDQSTFSYRHDINGHD